MSSAGRPVGTVTLLFTDIEGSTKMWEEHSSLMRQALARHDALLRAAIEESNGHIFKTVGDGFCAAFAVSSDALSAAISAQRSISLETWPEQTPMRVRFAVHSGAVESRDEDYFGQPLSRTARLLAIGHGGQILVSQTTYDLSRDSLPDDTTFADRGEHRLKDLGRPERVYQLKAVGIEAEFPPLKSLDNPELKHNLPQQVTSFIGREREITDIVALLEKTRVLTITGSGGSGKTRLSLQVAAELLDGNGDGVWFVGLGDVQDPKLVPNAVAGVLGVRDDATSVERALIKSVKTKRLLLLLDSCEHVIEACAQLVDEIIHACPDIKVLVTSREAMGISGELTYRIPSLSLPDPKRDRTPLSLSHFESAQLFIERAQFHRQDFAVDNQNAPALASICFRLDGIPLAIELAAARVRSLSLEEINHKLDQRFQLLTGGSRTSMPRQQTLRSLIDWSYDMLRDHEKRLLQRLSVFSGGWTLEAVENVCVDEDLSSEQMLDWLTSLSDKSLVVFEHTRSHSRYRLLETIRQYAKDRLGESEDNSAVELLNRHADYYLEAARKIDSELETGDQVAAIGVFESEHENFRASLNWFLNSGLGEKALLMASYLGHCWDIHGDLSEGRAWLERVLHAVDSASGRSRATALRWLGVLACSQSDYAVAAESLDASLGMFMEMGDRQNVAAVLVHLGAQSLEQAKLAEAEKFFQEALELGRSLNDKKIEANSLGNLGAVATKRGDSLLACSHLRKAVDLLRKSHDRQDLASALNNLANAQYAGKDFEGASELYKEAQGIYLQLSDQRGLAVSAANLGIVEVSRGNLERARQYHLSSLTIARELEDKSTLANVLTNLGDLAFAEGNREEAEGWHQEALELTRALGDPHEIAAALSNLGMIALAQGEAELAIKRLCESLRVLCELDSGAEIANVAIDLARALAMARQFSLVARVLGMATALMGDKPVLGEDSADVEALAGVAIEAIGHEAFTLGFESGEEILPENIPALLDELLAQRL